MRVHTKRYEAFFMLNMGIKILSTSARAAPSSIARTTGINALPASDQKPTNNINLIQVAYHFFKLRSQLADSRDATLEQLGDIASKWNTVVTHIINLSTSIGNEIAKMDKFRDGEKVQSSLNTAWKTFNDAMQECVTSATDLSTALTGYGLKLMSKLPNNDPKQAKNGTIYLSDDGTYIVRDPKGIVQTGSLDGSGINLKDLSKHINEQELKKHILEITSKAGHTTITGDIPDKEKTIAQKFSEILQHIPVLISSFDNLQINSQLKQLLPSSFDEMKKSFNKFVTEHIQNILPPDFEEKVKNYLSQKALTKKEFAKLSACEQDLRIVAQQELINLFKALYLFIDKLCIQLSLNKDYILNKNLEFLRESPHIDIIANYADLDPKGKKEKTVDELKKILRETLPSSETPLSLNSICANLCKTYANYMEVAKYEIKHELHPFPAAVDKQRRDMNSDLDSRIKSLEREDKQYTNDLAAAQATIISKIANKSKDLEKKKSIFNDNTAKINALNHLQNIIKTTDPKEVVVQLNTALTLGDISQLELRPFVDELIQKFKQETETRREQRLNALKDQQKYLEQKSPRRGSAPKPMDEESPNDKTATLISHLTSKTIPHLQENMRTLMALISTGSPKQQSAHNPNAIKEAIEQLEAKIKTLIDPEIYAKFFNQPIDKNVSSGQKNIVNIDAKHSSASKPIWIEEVALNLHHIKVLSAAFYEKASDSKLKREATPIRNLIKCADNLEAASTDLTHMIQHITELKKHPFIQQITDPNAMKASLSNLHIAEYHHALPPVILKNNEKAPAFLDRLKHIQKILVEHYKIDPAAEVAFKQAADNLKILIENSKHLTPPDDYSETSRIELMKFVISYATQILQVAGNIGHAITSLKTSANEFYLQLLEATNFLFKDIYLLFDKLEIQLYLREGYLSTLPILGKTSFNDLVTNEFYAKVKAAGYTFKAEECPPYTQDILAQRQDLLKSATSEADKALIQKRIDNIEQYKITETKYNKDLEAPRAALKKLAAKRVIDKKINDRIDQLNDELRTCLTSTNKYDKRHMLMKIRETYDFFHTTHDTDTLQRAYDLKEAPKKHDRFDDVLDFIAAQPDAAHHIHHLYEGRTGALIQELRDQETTRDDLINLIEIEIETLKQQRQESFYFSAASRRELVENKLFALDQLLDLIKKPGYSVADAFKELATRDKASHLILMRHENQLLRKLDHIGKYIMPQMKVIHYAKTPMPIRADHKTIDPDTSAQNETINNLITKRLAELRAKIQTSTVKNKIILLNSLGIKLHTTTLETALQQIHKEYPAINYLLFEGCTGAMIKSIQLSKLTQAQMLHKADLEIIRLKGQRPKKLYFFSQQRKTTLEKQIKAVVQLRQALETCSGIQEAFASLGAEDRTLLISHQQQLINDYQEWEKASTIARPLKIAAT